MHHPFHFGIAELQVVSIILFGHNQFELRIVEQVVYPGQVALIVDLLCFKYKLEHLEVEDGFIRIGLLPEQFDGPV